MRAASSPRSREERRARIEQVALELFRTRGFDQVTVEEICAAAEVGPATFYRYFGTKEEVVFAYRRTFAAALRTAIAAVADVPEPARLTAVVSDFASYLESQRELLAPRDEIVLGNPRLLQYTLIIQREWEAALADGLARLRGLPQPDVSAALEAGVGLLVLRVAVQSWRTATGGSLPAAAQKALTDLETIIDGWHPPGPS